MKKQLNQNSKHWGNLFSPKGDIKHLPKGIYILEIVVSNGMQYKLKFIKN